MNKNGKLSLPSISLFSGAGGLDLGLEMAGFDTAVFVESDEAARMTLRANRERLRRPDAPILGDITKFKPEDVLEDAGLQRGEATLVAGGPPCQSFSTAGRRGSIGDPRGGLLHYFVDVVQAAQPRFFVLENVRGILSAAVKHRPLRFRGNGHSPLEPDEELGSLLRTVILPALREQLKYEVVYGLVNSADYGVPQTRSRVIFLGSRDHEFGSPKWSPDEMPIAELLPPTFAKDSPKHRNRWRTLGQAIGSLADEDPEFLRYSSSRAAVLELVPAGKNWRYLRDTRGSVYLKKVMGGAYEAGGGKVGFWRRLSFDKPSPTVLASPIQKGSSLCHPVETRPLSVREYARVQEFPDDYVFEGSVAAKYKQIGNAVPIGLGRAIGIALARVVVNRELGGSRGTNSRANGRGRVRV